MENEESKIIFINGNVPSSKNGRVFNRKLKRSFPSKQTQRFVKESKQSFDDNKELFQTLISGKSKPYLIGFHFVRGSKHKYDFINPCQTIQDLMVDYEWIDDDNVTEMFPVPFEVDGQLSTYDKENPGVFIKIF